MKNIDSLMKQVELFERMAVYGDRSTFLKSLAQDVNAKTKLHENIKALLELAHQYNLDSLKGLDVFPNMNVKDIDSKITEALSKVTNPDAAGKLIQLQQDIRNLGSSPEQSEEITFPMDTIHGHVSVDPYIQQALNKWMAAHKLDIAQLTVDGKLGPQTRKALNAFKQIEGKNVKMTDDEAMTMLKAMDPNNPAKQME